MRHLYPIGPAPQNWSSIAGCSAVIPHIECADTDQNDQMNAEHTASSNLTYEQNRTAFLRSWKAQPAIGASPFTFITGR